MAKKRRTISLTVDEKDYEEISAYAKVKGHGGQHPTSTFAHYAIFQMMKKYPLSASETRKIKETHGITDGSAKAVQPDAPRG
jgi:hypothetical protein